MKITSPAFGRYQTIPERYTCEGGNIHPALNFEDVPETAKSLALITEDPDQPMVTWIHWVVFNMPPGTRKLDPGKTPPGIEGTTSFGKTGYGGPCPPAGSHRYYFKLYALDSMLQLPPSADAKALLYAMHGHELASAQLIGVYAR